MVIGMSFSRTHLVVLIVAAFCILVSANGEARAVKSKGAKPKPISNASAPAIKIQNTASFFNWYLRSGSIDKSEFETEQQFRKRIPWFDPEKIVYFRLDSTRGDLAYNRASWNISDSWEYAYDVDSQLLTVIGGECDGTDLPREIMKVRTLILVLQDEEELGTYIGTNAYGAKVKVYKSLEDKYMLNISNIDECPDTVCETLHTDPSESIAFDRGNSARFRISVKLIPQEAKKLSNRLQIVLGVKLMGYDRSVSWTSFTLKPTIDKPYDKSYSENIIDARVARVLLMDRVSGRILTEDVIGNK